MAKVLGLTGGIASGKSTVAALLRARGAAVVDADLLARAVVEPGQPALAELLVRFGPEILNPDGTLDRKALGARAFADPEARRDLDRITHPRIAAAAQAAIAAHAAAGAPVVLYEAALLIEKGLHRGLDGTVVVAVAPEVQAARLAERDGLDAAAVAARLAAQLPLADKVAVATWVVDNSGDRAHLEAEVERLCQALEDRYGALAAPTAETVPEDVLVIGAPSPVAMALCAHLLATDPRVRVRAVAPAEHAATCLAALAAHPPEQRARIELLTGDVAAMDLGLSTAEYLAVRATVTTIHHLAAAFPKGADARARSRTVLASTRNVLELAREAPRLRRVVHWSSIRAVGDGVGVVREAPLPRAPRFASVDARASYEAERAAVVAMTRLPLTVVRVGPIVGGDRRGGAGDDAATALFRLVAQRAAGLQVPLPADGRGPLHVAPRAIVVAAADVIARAPRAAGRVLHLLDPDPPTTRAALDRVAALAGREPLRGSIPRGLARMLLRAPGLERVAELPAAMLEMVAVRARFAGDDTQALLAEAGLTWPRFDAWIAPVVAALTPPPAAPAPPVDDDSVDPLA
ncbi:MAG: dephospho-CoA kinase [Myxococcales bacterium]|nr:dephospho-CoA kinase [Myxococcales bacterium]